MCHLCQKQMPGRHMLHMIERVQARDMHVFPCISEESSPSTLCAQQHGWFNRRMCYSPPPILPRTRVRLHLPRNFEFDTLGLLFAHHFQYLHGPRVVSGQIQRSLLSCQIWSLTMRIHTHDKNLTSLKKCKHLMSCGPSA